MSYGTPTDSGDRRKCREFGATTKKQSYCQSERTVANVVVAKNWTNHERIKTWPNVWDVMVQR
jgi:hypothetical protein